MKSHLLSIAAFAGFGALAAFSCGGDLDLTEPGHNPLIGVDCPAELPQTFEACGTEGVICAFPRSDANQQSDYSECACREAAEDDLRWHCYYTGSHSTSCPEERPTSREECFGSFGLHCSYPERITCSCSEQSGKWSCEGLTRQAHQRPPAAPSAERPINQLTDDERRSWCDWFAAASAGPGFPAAESDRCRRVHDQHRVQGDRRASMCRRRSEPLSRTMCSQPGAVHLPSSHLRAQRLRSHRVRRVLATRAWLRPLPRKDGMQRHDRRRAAARRRGLQHDRRSAVLRARAVTARARATGGLTPSGREAPERRRTISA